MSTQKRTFYKENVMNIRFGVEELPDGILHG